jgi:hypothetical protein
MFFAVTVAVSKAGGGQSLPISVWLGTKRGCDVDFFEMRRSSLLLAHFSQTCTAGEVSCYS